MRQFGGIAVGSHFRKAHDARIGQFTGEIVQRVVDCIDTGSCARPRAADRLLRARCATARLRYIQQIGGRGPAHRADVLDHALRDRFAIEPLLAGCLRAYHGHDCIGGTPAAETQHLLEPIRVERVAGLLRVQEDRVARNRVAVLYEARHETLDDRLISSDHHPSIPVAPTPAVALAKRVAQCFGSSQIPFLRRRALSSAAMSFPFPIVLREPPRSAHRSDPQHDSLQVLHETE